jgi:hypothetical protein
MSFDGFCFFFSHVRGVMDDGKYFERDTFLSGVGGHCDFGLVKTLSVKSREAIHFLAHDIGIPLSTLFQLGGHSRPRYGWRWCCCIFSFLMHILISLYPFSLCRCAYFCQFILVSVLTPSTHRVPDKADGSPVPVGYTIIHAMLDFITR